MSGDWELISPIITAAQAKLQAGVPAALVQRRTEVPVDQAAALLDPIAYLDYPAEPSTLENLGNGPVLCLVDQPTLIEDDTGSSASSVSQFSVLVWMVQPDQRLLAWGLRHYATVVTRVMMNDRLLAASGFYGLMCTGTTPGDTLGHDEDPREWISWTAVSFQVRREEDF